MWNKITNSLLNEFVIHAIMKLYIRISGKRKGLDEKVFKIGIIRNNLNEIVHIELK